MDCLFSVLAGSEETGGRFGLMEMVAPKGREPSRHLHYTDDEGFYVLDGEVTFYVGEEICEASSGTFVFLPHGVPHSYIFQDRRSTYALRCRAGRIRETLSGCSVQRASQDSDATPAQRRARRGLIGGDGQ